MPSLKIVDTQNVAIGGRSDIFWRRNKHFTHTFLKLRKPQRPIPKALDGANILDQQKVLQYFDLSGFEYGNWLSNDQRYNFLIGCVVSLLDLQDLIGIKNLGFKQYSIAFGARGRGGKSSAAAHFEPARHAINLTKEYGLEALAHEYGHLLDHFYGNYIDQDRNSQYLSYGRLSGASLKNIKGLRKGSLRYQMHDLLTSIVFENGKEGQVSSYYSQLSRHSKSEYFTRATEIFARTFEQWVSYKLKQKGVVNMYLAQPKYENWMYLSPALFKKILPKMNSLIKTMSSKTK